LRPGEARPLVWASGLPPFPRAVVVGPAGCWGWSWFRVRRVERV